MTTIPDDTDGGLSAGRFTATTGLRGRWAVIEVRGELDMATAGVLDEQVAAAVALQAPPWIALELSGLTFCDSAGLNVLIRAWKQTAGVDGRLVLLHPQDRLLRLLQITGLDRRLDVADAPPD